MEDTERTEEQSRNHSKDECSELRTRTEESLSSSFVDQEDISLLSPEEIRRLIHDLSVHRIELEVPNEDLRQAQLKLQALKDKYLDLYDFAPVGYITLNDKGVILGANLTACKILSVEKTDLIKMPFSHFVGKELGDTFYFYLRQVFDSQSKQTCEIKLSKKDGTVFHAQLESLAVLNETGQCIHCRTILSDITGRTQTEKNLRESERKYRSLVDNAPIGILLSDNQGNILEVNHACLEVLGSPGAEATKSINMLTFPPLVEAGISEAFRRCMAEARSIRHDTPYISQWGKQSHLRIILSPMLNEEGSVEGCQAVIEDITDRKRAEEELRQSEEKFRIVADFTHDWDYWIDMSGAFVYMSPSCERITGYSRVEFVENPSLLETIVHPDDKELVNDHTKSLREGKLPDECLLEFRIIDSTGEVHWIEHACQNVVGSNGTPLGRRASQREITKRKKVEEALSLSELRYRRLFESAQDGILILDFDTGKILDVNRYLIDLLGYPHEGFLGKHVWEVSPFKDTALNKAAFLELQEHGYVRYEDLPLETRDGRSIDVEFVTNAYLVNGKKCVQCNIRDITDRKLMENSLRESEKIKSMLLDNTQELFICLDKELHILWANKASSELLNLSTGALVGKCCFELWHGRTEPCEACPALLAMQSGLPQYGAEISAPDGRYWARRGYPVFDEQGNVIGATELVVDITTLKKAELEREELRCQFLQAQKMEAIGSLAGGVAHDFNNILQVVLGYCDLLLMNKKFHGAEHESLRRIQTSGLRGAELVKRLLTFSRRGDAKPRPLNLNHEATQVKNLLKHTLPKMITIELRLEDDVAVVNADPLQIEQILMNLSINARDAMSQEGGRLTIETKNVMLDEDYCAMHVGARPGPHVMLSVSDTGCGMNQETQQHVFEPFYTTKEAGQGTGLGLSIVYGIVKQHEGHTTCYSFPGEGTTFRIYFPVVPGEAKELSEEDTSIHQGGTETLLLVDDEEFVRDIGSELLEKAGYTVLTAVNGTDAIERYRKQKSEISLVILDLIMPVMGGIQCFKELVKIDPDIRVLMSSGFVSDGTEKDAREIGAKGFVEKPYQAGELLRLVREVLDKD